MNSAGTAVLTDKTLYDDCLISSCIKRLFKGHTKSRELPQYIICNEVAGIRNELGRLNTHKTIELSYDYLSAMEQSLPGAGFRYVVFHKNSIPILFCYFQTFTLTSKNFNLNNNKPFIKGIVHFFLDLKKIKALIAGNALRNETPCYCYDSSVINGNEATELIASAAEKIAADEKITAVLLKDIPASSHTVKWLSAHGYTAPMADRLMTLDINKEWASLPSYVSALSRKYKTRANKILALRDGLSIEALNEKTVTANQRQMNRLYKNVVENQPFALTSVGEDHFAKLKALYKDDFEIFGFFADKKLIAFYSAFVTPAAYEIYYVGFDYQLNDQYQLYFNILFSGLERAISLGKGQLKLGRTSFDSKASLGAKPVEISYFIKTMNIPTVAINWFVNYFASMEDGKWKLRNPLK